MTRDITPLRRVAVMSALLASLLFVGAMFNSTAFNSKALAGIGLTGAVSAANQPIAAQSTPEEQATPEEQLTPEDQANTEDQADPAVLRLGGSTSYSTSLAIARHYLDTTRRHPNTASKSGSPANTVIVASGRHPSDAAAAVALARAVNGPILLTPPNRLLAPAAELIANYGITNVIVVGGEAAVSNQVLAELADVPGVQGVERMAGANRYETAAGLALEAAVRAGDTPPSAPPDYSAQYCNGGRPAAILINGSTTANSNGTSQAINGSTTNADTAIAAQLSYAMGIPIMLTTPTGVPTATTKILKRLGVTQVIFVGGQYSSTDISSSDVKAIYDDLREVDVSVVTRLRGKNPSATAAIARRTLERCVGSSAGASTDAATASTTNTTTDNSGTASTNTVALISEADLPAAITAAVLLGGNPPNSDSTGDQKATLAVTPALLVRATELPPEAISFLRESEAIDSLVVIGGERSLRRETVQLAQQLANAGANTKNPAAASTGTASSAADACRVIGQNGPQLNSVGVEHTAGFPLPNWARQSKGVLKVAALFLDFTDASAEQSIEQEAAEGLQEMERYLEAASYGQLDVQITTNESWLRARNGWRSYTGEREFVAGLLPVLAKEAVKAASDDFDFSAYDTVLVTTPSKYFTAGAADYFPEVFEDEALPSTFAFVNVTRVPELDDYPSDPTGWWRTAAHELAHNLGLADLYAYNPVGASGNPFATGTPDKVWLRSSFGLMGLSSRSLQKADVLGSRSSGVSLGIGLMPLEMLAWSRWQLGWLTEQNVACLTEPTFEEVIALSPIAVESGTAELSTQLPTTQLPNSPVQPPGDLKPDDLKMVVIPLGESQAIVIESRRSIGYDQDMTQQPPSLLNASLLNTSLLNEGVLVYKVDATKPSGQLPITFLNASADNPLQLDAYPVMAMGSVIRTVLPDSSMLEISLTQDLTQDNANTHTIRITRGRV